MKHPWMTHALVYCMAAIIAILVLVQQTIGMDRTTWLPRQRGQQRAGRPQRPIVGRMTSAIPTYAISTLREKRIARGSFLAHRDRSGEQEWMDLPGQDPNLLTTMFIDLERVNRWLGGTWITTRGLDRIFRDHPASDTVTILDVASGSGDIPRAISTWARRRKRSVSVIATDINPVVLGLAHGADATDNLHVVAADAINLPFADDAVDVAACSFFLHHLDPPDVIAALREMRRVSRGTVLINDMVRGWPSFAGAWLFSRMFTRNPISRHDAPLSARRSYTRAELLELAAAAGLRPMATYGFAGYRVVLVTTDSLAAATTDIAPFRHDPCGSTTGATYPRVPADAAHVT